MSGTVRGDTTSVVLHSVGGKVGLGHLSRSIAVAGALRRYEGLHPVLITEAADSRLLDDEPFPSIAMPSLYEAEICGDWGGQLCTGVVLWRALLAEALRVLRPRLFVFDTFVNDDVLDVVQMAAIPAALLLRPRLHLDELSAHALSSMCLIVVAGDTWHAGLPAFAGDGRLLRTEPIVRDWTVPSHRSLVLARHGLGRHAFTIVVSNAGGGRARREDDFLPLVFGALREALLNMPDAQVVVVVGPLHPPDEPSSIDTSGRVQVHRFLPDLRELCWASHLVIGRGGYNTIHELAAMGVPSLCHPGWRASDDQAERIRSAALRYENIRPAASDPAGLAAQILDEYRRPRYLAGPVHAWRGARQAAAALASCA